MDFKGTQSEKNIQSALMGESVARNKYTYYAEKAKAEGREDISTLFEAMAKNEANHAKIWFKLLHGDIADTKSNLLDSITGENTEWTSMYPEFAKTAYAEGFEQLGIMFEKIADIEKNHEKAFLRTLIEFSSNPSAPKKEVKSITQRKGYRCQFCGATFDQLPSACSVCSAIGSFDAIMIQD